ncbi:MipA/OmpV family protein [Mycobacterium sp. KBS0706]|uniref:MipA/OmpV family protein n=1 Tax=Mycobacterium sp. KBS0706 TaxID=2578109 RepID=UPI00110FABA2|nr:MipA/OmpV family protein [Mycobacterium sp. KBS0706]TSD86173.1 MipA/OmpV family protein [Mycobacterium sp. KBS0706]
MRRAFFGRGLFPAAILCVTAAVQTAARSAVAQDEPPAEWSFTLGGGAMYAPDYEGSDDYTVMPMPFVEVSWRDRIRLSGLGIYATPFATDGLRFDLGVKYEFGRYEDDNDALKGLGDLEVGAVAVVRFGYEAGPVNLGLEVARDLTGDRNGLTATAEAEYAIQLDDVRLSVTPHLTWADDEYMSNSFGITAAQAARSARGLAAYDAGSGLKDAGINLGIGYMMTDSIYVMGQVGYSRLLGDAADSPLVSSEGSADQLSAMLGLSYRW